MNKEKFEKVSRAFFADCLAVLRDKDKDYGLTKDRLAQFKRIALMTGITPEATAFILLSKHITSICDMSDYPRQFTKEKWFEKLGDVANYMVLIYALIVEREEEDAN